VSVAGQALGIVQMRGIVKRFPGVLANDRIDFQVRGGEIHALLGENGAGKSTLMKVLYGMYRPEEGEILIDGRPVSFHSPTDAIRQGIGMVHQHFMLVPTFTVAENIALGMPSSRKLVLDLDRVSRRIGELARRYGMQVDPAARIGQLSVGEQQRVEILKALYRGSSLLILDEPTAVLTPQEAGDLARTLRRMAGEGQAVIFISHKLQEVLTLSDRITVLRDGRVVRTLPAAGTRREELARLMVGREVALRVERTAVPTGGARLSLEGIWVDGEEGRPALRGVDLEVRAGEILGIAGVSGNGQRELAETIVGLRRPTRGRMRLGELDATGWPAARRIEYGLSYVPEDPVRDGAVRDFSVEENLILKDHCRPPYARGIFLDLRRIGQECQRLIRSFEVRTPSRRTALKSLSGGNIQKLILARELSRDPRLLVAAQPTRGLDVSATEYVHRLLLRQREKGTATVLISEDLDEILALSDRVAVMYGGAIMGVVRREEVDIQALGLMMAGVPV
jgi:simple sugar transport system ATP-binding protein